MVDHRAANVSAVPLADLSADSHLAAVLARCVFAPAGSGVTCGLSGGADSTALVALAVAAGCRVDAVHVHHGLRADADHDAQCARATSDRLGIGFEVVRVTLADGPNLEARARAARRGVLGPDALTGHTLDDQAETQLLALLRGAGAAGLSAMRPGRNRPLLALRRSDTRGVCEHLGLDVADDPSNADPRFRRNRVRHEILPLLDSVADRDVTPLLARSADLLRDDDRYLGELSDAIDPTDARQLGAAPLPLARRAVRSWLLLDGYPPDAATVERVLEVARGSSIACDADRGRRVERHRQQLRLVGPPDRRPAR